MKDASPARFECTCGTVAGEVTSASRKTGTHVECFCADCRAAQIYLGQPDPHPNGVHIFQISPEMVHFSQGTEHLRILRLGPKGLMRWYADCCKAPLFNTLPKPTIPFAGLIVDRLQDPARIGKVVTQSFLPGKDGARRHKGALTMTMQVLKRAVAARMSGEWRDTPFFDIETGAPTAPVHILDKRERQTPFRS